MTTAEYRPYLTDRKHPRPSWNEEEFRKKYKVILEDYLFTDDVMSEDAEIVRDIKWVITHRLTRTEQTLLIAYAESESLRKAGNLFGLSRQTILNELNKIRKKITDEIRNLH